MPTAVRAVPFALSVLATLVPPALAQRAEPVDQEAIAILRKHGLEQSRVMDHLSWMCDVYGPRLTGSPNLERAQKWAVATLQSFGLANAHTESWGPFGRGWRLERCSVDVVGENPWQVIAYPKAWSPGLPGRVEADVVAVGGLDAASLEALDLTGKIVLVDEPRVVTEPFEATAKRFTAEDLLTKADQIQAASRPSAGPRPGAATPAVAQSDFRAGFARRNAMLKVVAAKKPLAIVDRGNKGDYGTVFVQGAAAEFGGNAGGARGAQPGAPRAPGARDVGVAVLPQFTFAVEHYNRICRILQKGLPVRLAIVVEASYRENELMERNVVAELPGSDPNLASEIVMVGGHFDSWHTGTGATDNGCGSAVAMEAMRLLAKLVAETGKSPRRTIRIGLWSGEEQGLLGSRAYVKEHFGEPGHPTPEHGKLAAYFNLDNGTGKVRGVYLQGNEAVAPIFRAWLRPFHDLGASTLTLDDTGGTDHLAFDGVGLPGFQFIQDPVSYDPKTHHSNMDVWDHVVASDLEQAATIEAAFLWHAANRDEKLPRKPLPTPGEGGGRRGRGQ